MASPTHRIALVAVWILLGLSMGSMSGGCAWLGSSTAPAETGELPSAASDSTTTASSDTTAIAPPDTTAVDTPAEEPKPIRVKISDEERAKLVAQFESDLQVATTRAATRPDAATLSAEQRQRWDTLDQYIELARSSWETGDVRAAADLALKARLLADEMQPD
jgi:hypothetical protein